MADIGLYIYTAYEEKTAL